MTSATGMIEYLKGDKSMSIDGAGDRVLQITLPDPDDEDLLHSFSVDTENEGSLVNFLYSLLEIYGDDGEDIAAKILGWRLLARAVCGALVQEGKLVRVDDEHYRIADDAGLPH